MGCTEFPSTSDSPKSSTTSAAKVEPTEEMDTLVSKVFLVLRAFIASSIRVPATTDISLDSSSRIGYICANCIGRRQVQTFIVDAPQDLQCLRAVHCATHQDPHHSTCCERSGANGMQAVLWVQTSTHNHSERRAHLTRGCRTGNHVTSTTNLTRCNGCVCSPAQSVELLRMLWFNACAKGRICNIETCQSLGH